MEQVYLQIIREQAAYIRELETFIKDTEKDLRELKERFNVKKTNRKPEKLHYTKGTYTNLSAL